jgi:hypothetical protein
MALTRHSQDINTAMFQTEHPHQQTREHEPKLH